MRYSVTRDSFSYATFSCEFQADVPDLAFLEYAYIPVTQRRTVQRDAILNCPTGSRDRCGGARSCILRVGLLYVMYEVLELLRVGGSEGQMIGVSGTGIFLPPAPSPPSEVPNPDPIVYNANPF
jgi:hypothetical protein